MTLTWVPFERVLLVEYEIRSNFTINKAKSICQHFFDPGTLNIDLIHIVPV